jgi:hypothetical protein
MAIAPSAGTDILRYRENESGIRVANDRLDGASRRSTTHPTPNWATSPTVVAEGAQAWETQFLSAADRVLAVLSICPTRDHGPTDPMRRLLEGCARPPDNH